jgi:hypothetical protein
MNTDQEEAILLVSGSLTLKAVCTVNSSNNDFMQLKVASAQDGWFLGSGTTSRSAGEVLAASSNGATHSTFETRTYWDNSPVVAWSPDGSFIAVVTPIQYRFHLGGSECGLSGVAYFIEGAGD